MNRHITDVSQVVNVCPMAGVLAYAAYMIGREQGAVAGLAELQRIENSHGVEFRHYVEDIIASMATDPEAWAIVL